MRRTLAVLHRWVGLALAVPLLLQAASGVILVMTPLVTPLWQPVPLAGLTPGAPQPASAVLAASARPGLVPVGYRLPSPGHPAVVELGVPEGRLAECEVLVDPVSLTVLGTRLPSRFYRVVRQLHENLLLAPIGRSIVGWFGLGLLLLAVSGAVLWWPLPGRWRAAVSVSARARGARLQRELHGAAGFYACAMLAVMSVSGITLAFPQTIRSILALPAGGGPGRGARGGNMPVDIDAVIARAQLAVPQAAVEAVRIPSAPGRPVFVTLRATGAAIDMPPILATIDPAGRRVLSLRDPRTEPAAEAVLGWLRAMHEGDAFGLAWRLLVGLAGVLLPVLSVTGAALWLLRRRNRRRLELQRRAALAPARP